MQASLLLLLQLLSASISASPLQTDDNELLIAGLADGLCDGVECVPTVELTKNPFAHWLSNEQHGPSKHRYDPHKDDEKSHPLLKSPKKPLESPVDNSNVKTDRPQRGVQEKHELSPHRGHPAKQGNHSKSKKQAAPTGKPKKPHKEVQRKPELSPQKGRPAKQEKHPNKETHPKPKKQSTSTGKPKKPQTEVQRKPKLSPQKGEPAKQPKPKKQKEQKPKKKQQQKPKKQKQQKPKKKQKQQKPKHPHDPKPAHPKASPGRYPFRRVVAFGDNLSDNGNGSYAHHVVSIGQPNNSIYGFGTWTDGPVAVSYLSDMLNVPLAIDYAFGHAQGGSRIGATINSSYTYSMYAPDGFTQVHNYTSTSGYSPEQVASTLHFVWIGNNDINLLHLYTTTQYHAWFAEEMSRQMTELVGRLIKFGAQHVFVPGLYAKQLSPSWHFYAKTDAGRRNLGLAIKQANAAIKSELEKHFGKKVLYYDVFGRMMDIWNNHGAYGIKYVGNNFCDGHSQEDWNICVTQHKGDEFYWMQFLDMTSRVHYLIAKDMHRALAERFGVS